MPPANSRATSPPDSALNLASPSYLSPLRELEPVNQDVLHLADTLTTETVEQPTEPSETPEVHMERSRRRRTVLEQQERMRRVMNRLSRRIQDPPGTSYGDRVPRQNYLYDWSPANEANEANEGNEADEADAEDELDQMLAEMASARSSPHPNAARMIGLSQPDGQRERRIPAQHPSQLPSAAENSLRSAAVLQSLRRHPRFASHRTMARDPYTTSNAADTRPLAIQRLAARRSLIESEMERERERQRTRSRDLYPEPGESEQLGRDRDVPARSNDRQRYHVVDSAKQSSAANALLERTIRYLAKIRHVDILEGHECAVEAALLQDNLEPEPDFLLHTFGIPPPPPSSWLTPGAILSGCQHATSLSTTVTTSAVSNTLYRFRNGDYLTSTLFDFRNALGPEYVPAHERHLPSTGQDTVLSHTPQQDRWPVKVIIHTVDYENMSLSATMEAYNVPSHPHSHQSYGPQDAIPSCARVSSITTYLEGEILDFNQHTLLTESFKSTAANDATYWHKLPCFRGFSVEELAENLTDRRFYAMLARDWILMRWKERCFVKKSRASTSTADESHDLERESGVAAVSDEYISTFDDSNCGLTISGFYYICLRREDGKLEGLYCDPQSSPYQCLKLDSVSRGAVPARAFR